MNTFGISHIIRETLQERKIVQAMIDTGVTYNEVEPLLKGIINHYRGSRECTEYETTTDFFAHNKCCEIGDEIIKPWPVDVSDLMEKFGLTEEDVLE